ncbi:hypothetical protein EDD29_4360 [Actinocorallia herbida]|uniref:Uncharacterized protein n=1 Tax=Actinocorallia herbida TaxID=58109 RepID=A0A3N1CZS1_9ACTN|nr:hypothetical protein EDD29_4360 [Actinocorallia herbida]
MTVALDPGVAISDRERPISGVTWRAVRPLCRRPVGSVSGSGENGIRSVGDLDLSPTVHFIYTFCKIKFHRPVIAMPNLIRFYRRGPTTAPTWANTVVL